VRERVVKVLVEAHVPAWHYLDTETGEIEMIEVWAFDDELKLMDSAYVLAEDAADDRFLTVEIEKRAREQVMEWSRNYQPGLICVAMSEEATTLQRRAGEAMAMLYRE
jgi:hypothetical protein